MEKEVTTGRTTKIVIHRRASYTETCNAQSSNEVYKCTQVYQINNVENYHCTVHIRMTLQVAISGNDYSRSVFPMFYFFLC